jgi:hypothetical protein
MIIIGLPIKNVVFKNIYCNKKPAQGGLLKSREKRRLLLWHHPDLPPASRTKVMAVSPQILENCGYEDHTIYR